MARTEIEDARIERLSREREELARASRAKDEFLAILSHQLRNHIQTIGTNALLVKARSNDAEVTRPAEAVSREVQRLSRLLDDLLDVVRVTRRSDLVLEPVELQRIVGKAIQCVRNSTDLHRRELTVDMPDEPLFVNGDEERLAKAVFNIVQNAVKYSPQQGAIGVIVSRENGHATVSVRDQGIGIDPDELPHLFTLFRQSAAARAGKSEGLGIGLHVAREVAEAHGGKIEARSAGLGLGSQFVLRLPVTSDRPAGEESEHGSEAVQQALAILVVDDNRDAADSLAEVLQVYGHRIKVAYRGEDAIALARQGGIDVALVDIGLPTINGYEVARQICALPEAKRTVLVAVTGWGAKADRARSKEAGFAYHLTKPLDYPTLLSLLSSAARNAGRAA